MSVQCRPRIRYDRVVVDVQELAERALSVDDRIELLLAQLHELIGPQAQAVLSDYLEAFAQRQRAFWSLGQALIDGGLPVRTVVANLGLRDDVVRALAEGLPPGEVVTDVPPWLEQDKPS